MVQNSAILGCNLLKRVIGTWRKSSTHKCWSSSRRWYVCRANVIGDRWIAKFQSNRHKIFYLVQFSKERWVPGYSITSFNFTKAPPKRTSKALLLLRHPRNVPKYNPKHGCKFCTPASEYFGSPTVKWPISSPSLSSRFANKSPGPTSFHIPSAVQKGRRSWWRVPR